MSTIAVLHALVPNSRQVTIDHTLCFARYLGGTRVLHHNIVQPPRRLLEHGPVDLVVLGYCFLSRARRSAEAVVQTIADYRPILQELGCPVVAIPQDDFKGHDLLDHLIDALDAAVVFSPVEAGHDVLYPRSFGRRRFELQLTGYVDEDRVARRSPPPLSARPIDVGTRVRFTSACLGRFARLKGEQALMLEARLRDTGLVVDISTAPGDALLGERWFDFLAGCRFTVGRKGGASIADPDGSIGQRVNAYLREHPAAGFDAIEDACFPGLDVHVFEAASPRLFEAALTRTCQILAPDDYPGELQPWVHYVPLDDDGSNLDEVVAAIADVDRAQEIADACYDVLIASGRFTYAGFARTVAATGGDPSPCGPAERIVDPATEPLLELPRRFGPEMLEAYQQIPRRLAHGGLLPAFRAAAETARAYAADGIDLPPGRLAVEVPDLAAAGSLADLCWEYATVAAAAGATDALLAWVDAEPAERGGERGLPWIDPWAFEPV